MAIGTGQRYSHWHLFFSPHLSPSCSPSFSHAPEGQPGADSLTSLSWVPGELASLCLLWGPMSVLGQVAALILNLYQEFHPFYRLSPSWDHTLMPFSVLPSLPYPPWSIVPTPAPSSFLNARSSSPHSKFEHREWEFSGDLMFQKLVKIEDVADVAVSFILEEWGHLDQSQKSLYRDDRKENYENITSMGKTYFICMD